MLTGEAGTESKVRAPRYCSGPLHLLAIATVIGLSPSALAQSPPEEPPPLIRGTAAGASSAATTIDPTVAAPASPINYAKPKKRLPLLPKKLGPQSARPLPDLQPYRTAPGQRRRDRNAPADRPGPTVAAIPTIPQPRRPIVDPAPFAPIGIEVGNLRLTPYVESDIGYDTNPVQSSGSRKGSFFGREEGGLGVQSNWSTHEFDATLRGGYSNYFTAHSASRPDVSAVANTRVDVTRDLAIDAQGRFTLDSQRADSPGLLAGTVLSSRPLTYVYGGSLGATQKFNRVAVSLRGSVDRYAFDDASVAGGTTIPLSAENYSAYGLRGRVGYEATPGASPFIEARVDTRRYDATLDNTGYARNSNGYGLRVGSTFELTRALTGEVAGGYAKRSYADTRLRDLSGPTFDASLVWTTSPLTTITLRGATDFAETTVAGASGELTRKVSIELAHTLLRNFTLTGIAAYENDDFQGVNQRQNSYSLGLRADYNVTRSIVIRSSFTHQRLLSNVPGADYTANTVLLGLKLQQ